MASSDPLNPVTFLTFLENIPASSNAFTATADHITDLRKAIVLATSLPRWGRDMVCIMLCAHVLMLSCSIGIFYIKIKSGTLFPLLVSRGSLLQPSPASIYAFFNTLYCIVTICDFTMALVDSYNPRLGIARVVLPELKYLALCIPSWFFIWYSAVLACYLRFNPPSNLSPSIEQIPSAIRSALNYGFSLGAIILPGMITIWVGIGIGLDNIRKISENVILDLRKHGEDWNESDFSIGQVLQLVQPLARLGAMLDSIIKQLRRGYIVWMVLVAFMTLMHVPTIISTYCQLRNSDAQVYGKGRRWRFWDFAVTNRQDVFQDRLLDHLVCAVASMITLFLFYPLIIYQINCPDFNYSQTSRAYIAYQLGGNLQYSITGNIIGLLALKWTLQLDSTYETPVTTKVCKATFDDDDSIKEPNTYRML